MAINEGSIEVIGTGKKLRTSEVTTSEDLVQQEMVNVSDPETGEVARVLTTTPSAADAGMVVRPISDSASPIFVSDVRTPAFFASGTISSTGVLTTLGLIDGSIYSLVDFHSVIAPGSDLTLAVEGTNDPAAAIGDAPGTKGWAALEVHGTNGGKTTVIRNSGRQLLQNLPRSVRVRCTQYVSGSVVVSAMAKPVPEAASQRYISDQDGLARWAMTTFGQGQVAQRLFLIGGNFDDSGKFSDEWLDDSSLTGSLTQTNGVIELHTGTNAAGVARIQSARNADFIGGVDNVTTIRPKMSGVPDGTFGFRFGAYTTSGGLPYNGWFVEVTGAADYTFKFVKNGVASASPFGTIGFTKVLPNISLNLWEITYNPNFVIFRNSGNMVQLLLGTATLDAMFAEYDLPLTIEAFNSGSTSDHTLFVQTATTERLGQQATSAVDVSPIGINSFDTENGSPIPTNGAPWLGIREPMDDYVQQTLVFDRVPMTAFGVVTFTYAKTKLGAASIENLSIPVTAGLPFIPVGLANVGNWFKVDFTPDALSPPITSARLYTQKFKSLAPDITRFLNQEIFANEPVKNIRAAIMGAPPDANDNPDTTAFQSVRVSGRHTLGTLNTPLPANTSGAGKWFNGLGEFLMGGVDIETDVTCQWRVEFSDADVPVEYTDDSVEDFTDFETYEPSQGIDKGSFAFLTQWARLKVVCGDTAMSRLDADMAYFVQPLVSGLKQARRPIKRRSLVSMGDVITESRTQESADGAEEYVQDKATLNSDTGRRGKNAHITGIDVPIGIKPLTSGNTSQVVCGVSAATRLDPLPIADRKSVMFANMEVDTVAGGTFTAGNPAVWSHDSGLTEANGFDLTTAIGPISLLAHPDLPIYVRAKSNGSGTTNTQTRTGSTASGTATNPNNAKLDDAVYANITAAAQTLVLSGFTITPTLTTLQNIGIRIKGKKQSGQFQTVAWQEVQIGNSTGIGSVTSAAFSGSGSEQLYEVFVGREVSSGTNGTVSGVAVAGLTAVQVGTTQNSDDDKRRIDIWRAYGTGTTAAAVATFATVPTSARIAAHRITGADPTTPEQATGGTAANNATVTGPALAGTNLGLSILGAMINNATSTAGAGYTERSDDGGTTGTSNNMTTETKALVATGSETGTFTLSGAKHYACIAATILPSPAVNPQVTVSYKLSAVAGATTQSYTFTGSSPETFDLDITGDRTWAFTDIPNVELDGVGLLVGNASADIDVIELVIVETSSPTVRVCLHQGAHPDG